MAVVIFSPIGNEQYFDNDGNPLSGGKIYYYQGGSFTIKRNTYSDSAGTIFNTNPIVLNSAGRSATEVFVEISGSYNIVLANSDGTILQSWENVSPTLGGGGYPSDVTIQTITANAAQSVFTLSSTYVPGTNDLQVYVNGLRLLKTTDYTETSANTFTLTANSLSAGDLVTSVITAPINVVNTNQTSYTPTLSTGGTTANVGNGTLTGSYWELGDLVNFEVSLTLGSTSNLGTGELRFSLPETANTTQVVGSVWATANSVPYTGIAKVTANTSYVVAVRDTTGVYTATSPATFASTDTIRISGSYFKS